MPKEFRTVSGSSPQARGTLKISEPARRVWRFIPAGAGNTELPGGRVERILLGSSPQARGTLALDGDLYASSRFIPAGAGNTSGYVPAHLARPRFIPAGAGNTRTSRFRGGFGSSPQARGTLQSRDGEGACARFIPAGAGNTWACRHSTSRTQSAGSSPQARGTLAASQTIGAAFGSSPQARGTPPTHATGIVSHCFGSSPQARGTRPRIAQDAVYGRFIPAGAGNTPALRDVLFPHTVHPRRRGEHPRPRSGRRQPQTSVHPRRRGEHCSSAVIENLRAGSSPQARGTPVHLVSECGEIRFIPAGAGNTPSNLGSARLKPTSVHPRRRGEHTSYQTQQSCGVLAFSKSYRLFGVCRRVRTAGLPGEPDLPRRLAAAHGPAARSGPA